MRHWPSSQAFGCPYLLPSYSSPPSPSSLVVTLRGPHRPRDVGVGEKAVGQRAVVLPVVPLRQAGERYIERYLSPPSCKTTLEVLTVTSCVIAAAEEGKRSVTGSRESRVYDFGFWVEFIDNIYKRSIKSDNVPVLGPLLDGSNAWPG